jgi:tetratricopeptide (TPR) repeat protein
MHHYNPDWLSDDDLAANFVARQEEFAFLRNELARTPREGGAQHYLLVGVRGAGKTTLLKRLAVAVRRDNDLNDHLIALSFPEELYQVKHLADFWWAACEALADELDRDGRTAAADQLLAAVDRAKGQAASDDALADDGLRLLLETCAGLERRPVLLADNLDLVFQRIEKTGRKLKNPHAPAYWSFREALSTAVSPVVIGGSVRLSEPFTDYDKAFYDFFIPKRLGKLPLGEVRRVLERLADARGLPEIRERLQTRPGRLEALHELTGGNPRALGLIFELLRQGPNSRAVEDFERLMDSATPYYKARFEDLSDQAQVVMHALAVRRPGDGQGLRFGHTAAEIGGHARLPTNTVSAQLDILTREGLVEKNAAHGRTQYRIAEQLFRLWLQMRGNRRLRQNVIGLTEFLEALFEPEELRRSLHEDAGANKLAHARLVFAVADAGCLAPLRQGLLAHGADAALRHTQALGEPIESYLTPGDLPEDLAILVRVREQLRLGNADMKPEEQDGLLGSTALSSEQKERSVKTLCSPETAEEEVTRLQSSLEQERGDLVRWGLRPEDVALLWRKRAMGLLPLPDLKPQDAESACLNEQDASACRAMVWRLIGARDLVRFTNDEQAREWLNWGLQQAEDASAVEWANVAGAMRRSHCFEPARQVLDYAAQRGEVSRVWYERGALLAATQDEPHKTEAAYRKAIELDPTDAWSWYNLGNLLADKLKRSQEAEAAYHKAIELDPADFWPWYDLGFLLADKLNRPQEAEAAYRKAIELAPAHAWPWNSLGVLLANKLDRLDEAAAAYRMAIKLDSTDAWSWINLGALLGDKLNRPSDAEAAYRKAIELAPTLALAWCSLGNLLADKGNFTEAAAVFAQGAALEPDMHPYWRIRYTEVQARLASTAAQQAMANGNAAALTETLTHLATRAAVDLAAALVSPAFIEEFLAPSLKDAHQAETLLTALRAAGYDRHARPLLLAYEAALNNSPDMLSELEPEVQGAARRLHDRLTTAREPL